MGEKSSNAFPDAMYLHCGECIEELPEKVSMLDFKRYQVMIHHDQIIIVCERHDGIVAQYTLTEPPEGMECDHCASGRPH